MEQTFTAKLIPSSYTLKPSGSSKFYITNADNIYSDTSSNEYATIYNNYGSAYSGSIDLHFDLTELEHFEEASSVNSFSLSIKVGNCYNASNLDWIIPYVENDGTTYSPEYSKCSHTISWGLNPDAAGKSITSINTSAIEPHLIGASDLWITVNCKQSSDNYTNYLYICGAELNITYTITKNYNKIIYGNNTLIDLAGDTATASDVAIGKTFHLASGEQATGTFSASMKTKTASLSSAKSTISFTGLEKEPSWFVAILDGVSTRTSYPAPAFLFNGTACFALYCYSTTSNAGVTCNFSSTSDYTFTYSSGKLILTINGSYFPKGSYILYYL